MLDRPSAIVDRRRLMLGSASMAMVSMLSSGRNAVAQDAVAPPPSAAKAADAVANLRERIVGLSRDVWANAELSLNEVKSSALHIEALEAEGFRIVSKGTAGVPTAFVAEWSRGSGGATVGYLPEYDALPGLGNAAEPRQTPGPQGAEIGHGCGHNMIGAGCTGGAFALKAMMEADGVPGTIRVYGCAAEETEGAKVYMAREGLFGDVDAVLAFHPAPFAGAGTVRMNATNNAKIIFRGKTSHAGNTPWEGRSALKAAENFGMGIQQMREHILPTARIHYIYENAGVAPNVVPDFAQIWITIRDIDRANVNAMTEWVRGIAAGAALSTQTEAEVDLFFGMYDLLPNEPLAQLFYKHIQATPLEWTDEEQDFARKCQKEMGVPEDGMATRPLPFISNVSAGGSTDIGDISYQAPAGVFAWPTLPLNMGLHTWPVTACAGMSIGDKASLNTARILAAAGYDIMTDPALREAAKADFAKRKGDTQFVSPLPPSRKAPLTLPAYLHKTGRDEVFADVKTNS
jgi:aminobenzoyl-glutamate utilization protein B